MTGWLGRIPDLGEPGFWALPTTSGDVAQLGERLVCNQEVAGSIPVVSILNLYATITYNERYNEEIKSTWAACRVALCSDTRLSFLLSLLAVGPDQCLAVPPERKMLG
jgi:hypothetical protein